MRANTRKGYGPWSTQQSFRTDRNIVRAPLNVKAMATSDSSVQVKKFSKFVHILSLLFLSHLSLITFTFFPSRLHLLLSLFIVNCPGVVGVGPTYHYSLSLFLLLFFQVPPLPLSLSIVNCPGVVGVSPTEVKSDRLRGFLQYDCS